MSLVVARKGKDNSIIIVSDTKLAYVESMPLLRETSNPLSRQTGNPLDGTIKSVIVNKNICVSFAGDVSLAHSALLEIQESMGSQDVLTILKSWSRSNETDFMLCTAEPAQILKIYQGGYIESGMMWIGDKKAFGRFRSYYGNEIRPEKANMTMMRVEQVLSADKQNGNVSSSFDDVISDSSITAVDGFKVVVESINGAFRYKGYNHNYQGPLDLWRHGPGTHAITHGTVEEGAYNINFFNSIESFYAVAVHVREGPFGIVYTRLNNGCFEPSVVHMDEVDFADYTKEKYGIQLSMSTQDRGLKFYNDALRYFERKQWDEAINAYNKVISSTNKKLHAIAHYNKGLSFLNVKNIRDGLICINQAIALDSKLKEPGNKVIAEVYRRLQRSGGKLGIL